MSTSKTPYVRGEQVMRLLATHGALSLGTLRSVMEPEIAEKRLEKIIARLADRRLVRRRIFELYGGRNVFYEIAEPFRSRLGIAPVHSAVLIHNDLVALTVEWFKRKVPAARFSKEHAIPRDPELSNVMKYQLGARDTLPDILMTVPVEGKGRRPVHVAIEIERTMKSTKRLLRKFSKYASRTILDGVLYLSEDKQLLASLSERYQGRVVPETRRIAHYKDHFFVTAAVPNRQILTLSQAETSAGKPVDLEKWIQEFVEVAPQDRRDSSFGRRGAVPSQQG